MQRTKLNSQANTARLSLPANLRMSPRLEKIGNLFAGVGINTDKSVECPTPIYYPTFDRKE
jgi:hypothetical protein